MPSSITHQLIAEEVLPLLPPEGNAAALAAPDEYFLGAQGPDFLFFYRIGSKSEYNLGKFMHRYRVYDLFLLLLRALGGDEKDPQLPRFSEEDRTRVLAYAMGYLTHYCADTTFHPFVYRYLETNRAHKRVHQQMENDWDVYFLRELRGEEAEEYEFPFSRKQIMKHRTLPRLYDFLAQGLGRQEVKERKFGKGLKNFFRYLEFFHGKCYRSQRAWERTEKFFRTKGFMSRLYPRKDPEPEFLGGEHFAEFSEGKGTNADALFARAVNESARLATLFLAASGGAPLPREEFGNGLLTGKPVA